MAQIDIKDHIRILGVMITPSLNWTSQFELMQKKMDESVTKLMATSINTQQAYLYFNIYLVTSVYFSVGIIELYNQQIVELKRIYEAPLLINYSWVQSSQKKSYMQGGL